MENLEGVKVIYSRNPLELEINAFNSRLPELLESDLGRWALIQESEFIGIYDTENDAIKVGFQTCGNMPFLTRQILEHQPEFFYHFDRAS